MKHRAGCRRVGPMSWLMLRGVASLGNRRRVMMRAYLSPFSPLRLHRCRRLPVRRRKARGREQGARGGRREGRANRLRHRCCALPMSDGKRPRDEESSAPSRSPSRLRLEFPRWRYLPSPSCFSFPAPVLVAFLMVPAWGFR